MSDKETLERALSLIRHEIQATRERLRQLELTAENLQRIVAPDRTSMKHEESNFASAEMTTGRFSNMGSVEAARIVLSENGRPMSLWKIAEKLASDGFGKSSNVRKTYSSIYGAIKRRNDIFVRVKENPVTYALKNMDEGK